MCMVPCDRLAFHLGCIPVSVPDLPGFFLGSMGYWKWVSEHSSMRKIPKSYIKVFVLGLCLPNIFILYRDSFFYYYVKEIETDLSEIRTSWSIHITYSSCNWKNYFKRQYQTVSIGINRHVTGVRKKIHLWGFLLFKPMRLTAVVKTSEVKKNLHCSSEVCKFLWYLFKIQ